MIRVVGIFAIFSQLFIQYFNLSVSEKIYLQSCAKYIENLLGFTENLDLK